MENVADPVTSRPFLMLSSLALGRFVANSKTSLVFSGGTCLRTIWPGALRTLRGELGHQFRPKAD
jgi:hypothetical protein